MALAVKEALCPPTQTKISGNWTYCLGEIDDLGHVRQVVARKRDDFGPPAPQQAKIGPAILHLQIDKPDLVPGAPHRLRDELEPQRLEPQENPGIEQRTGVDTENPHGRPLLCRSPARARTPAVAEGSTAHRK
jgi:hypothetical protein